VTQTVRDLVSSLDRRQRGSAVLGFPIAVAKKFAEDEAPGMAVLIAYWAFLSLFPLLLAFAAILGFVLQDDPALQHDVVNSVIAHVPVIGDQLRRDPTSLTGSGVALAVGVIGAIWAGLGVTLALGKALDELWGVPRMDRPGFVGARARGLALLAVLGTSVVASTVAIDLARTGRLQPDVVQILGFAASALLDLGVFTVAFRVLTAADVSVRRVLPGAVLATLGWLGLQLVGGIYVEHVVARSNETYGVFAGVIGLLAWLWLAAQLTLVAAEVNVVRAEQLWPRALAGVLTAADIRALRRTAESEQRDRRETISVAFDDGEREDLPANRAARSGGRDPTS
jgi:YihY family inner membrane protein